MAEFKLNPQVDQKLKFTLTLSIQDGWHINSDQPLQDDLVATSVSLVVESNNQLEHVQYPSPQERTLAFLPEPLSLFEGKQIISGIINPKAKQPLIRFRLKLQACSNELCLMPEQSEFTLTRPGLSIKN